MQKPMLGFIAVALMAAAVYGLLELVSPPPEVEGGPPPAEEIMYICRETGVTSFGPRQPTPAVNPQTGKATLIQALYCPDCAKWYPAPPRELSERLPTGPRCPTHGTGLLETIPEPEDDSAEGESTP